MNSYLKPQSPIKDRDGDYIYPLTTIDQIIMSDGSRLSNSIISDVQIEDILTESANYANTQITDRVINGKGKNLLNMRNAKGGESAGITVSVNSDGSYSYTGTATDSAVNVWLLGGYARTDVLFTLKPGKYYIDGVWLINNVTSVSRGNQHILTVTEPQPVTGVRAPTAVVGTTYNKTIYPIIALSDVAVDWEPYYEGLKELTDRGMELLWENASPDSAFATQTISLNLTDFWGCIIITAETSVVIKKNFNAQLRNVNNWGLGANEFQDKIRACSVNKNHIWFADSFYITNAASVVRNTDLIPIQIYGIKGGIA